jgi:hypothetical protein
MSTTTEDERWTIRPAGDFPFCGYCDNYCEIVDAVGEYGNYRKFAKSCGKCEKPKKKLIIKPKKKLIIKPKKKLIIKKKIEEEVEEVDTSTYVVRLERAVYGGEHGDIIAMETADEVEFDNLEEARTEFNDYVVENVGELLYLDEIFEDGDQDNLECRGELGQDY